MAYIDGVVGLTVAVAAGIMVGSMVAVTVGAMVDPGTMVGVAVGPVSHGPVHPLTKIAHTNKTIILNKIVFFVLLPPCYPGEH